MIDIIAIWIGRIILLALSLLFIGFVLWLSYLVIDRNLKRLIGWKHIQMRKDIIYFCKHKRDIQEYIKNKSIKQKIQ